MKIKIISTIHPQKCNCVLYCRQESSIKFPYNQWTISDKTKIINTKIPMMGSLVIMNIGIWYWRKGKKVFSGHLGIVRGVKRKSNGEYYITIYEANRVRCAITETSGTEKELKILGYRATNIPKPAPKPKPAGYSGNSIVDFLKSKGMPSSFWARRKLYKRAFGTWRYFGWSKQNTNLLAWCRRTF